MLALVNTPNGKAPVELRQVPEPAPGLRVPAGGPLPSAACRSTMPLMSWPGIQPSSLLRKHRRPFRYSGFRDADQRLKLERRHTGGHVRGPPKRICISRLIYEDRGARISIMARATAQGPDTLLQTCLRPTRKNLLAGSLQRAESVLSGHSLSHASHLGRWHRIPMDQGGRRSVRTVRDQIRYEKT
jgi:hypothetical protein